MSALRAPTELEVEAIALGELDAAKAGLVVDGERLAALRASDEEIRARYPSRAVAARVRDGVARSRRSSALRFGAVLAPAAAACALLLVVLRPAPARLDEAPDVTVEKGLEPELVVYAVREGAATRVDRAAPGDRVQLALVGLKDENAAVISVDGAGHVTRHFPREPAGSTQIAAPGAARGELHLPDGFELDDAPAFERFVLVTSPAPIDVAAVERAAAALAPAERRDAPLSLPVGLRQTSRVIEKLARHP